MPDPVVIAAERSYNRVFDRVRKLRAVAILFLHGAGGYADDQVMADAIGAELDEPVRMPQLHNEDMSHAAWSAQIADHLDPDVDTVVGHSFGGSTFLKMLTEADLGIARLVLLAAPDWGPDGWDVADYALPGDAHQRLPSALRIDLHHCTDDAEVPVVHLDLLSARMPHAAAVRHRHGGHQFEGGALEDVVRTLR